MARAGSRWDRILKRAVGALFAPAPDPRQAFADPAARQQVLLAEVRRARGALAAARQRLQTNAARVEAQLPQCDGQARQALRVGREDLARLALQRRQAAEAALKDLAAQAGEIDAEEGKLAIVEHRLTAQIDAIAARRHLLAARYSAAAAQVTIGEALTGLSGELAEVGSELARAERRTGQLQARAAAIDAMVADGLLPPLGANPLAGVTAALDRLDDARALETRLEALKRELAGDA
jgi:phage shock protein A